MPTRSAVRPARYQFVHITMDDSAPTAVLKLDKPQLATYAWVVVSPHPPGGGCFVGPCPASTARRSRPSPGWETCSASSPTPLSAALFSGCAMTWIREANAEPIPGY